MTTQELQTQLLSLSSIERSNLIQFLTHSLEAPWQGICKTPGVMGGEACVRDTRIPVWLLVSYTRLGLSEAKLLDNYPTMLGAMRSPTRMRSIGRSLNRTRNYSLYSRSIG